jgi:hypothetical protein
MEILVKNWWGTLNKLPYDWQLSPRHRDAAIAAHVEATRALVVRGIEARRCLEHTYLTDAELVQFLVPDEEG